VKFTFINAEKASFPVTVLCRVLEVSRSGFYASLGRKPSAHARRDSQLAAQIAIIQRESKQRCGARQVHAELQARGFRVSRKRVARLMRAMGLQSTRKRRYRSTTDSSHKQPVAGNVLARRFTASKPNTAWVTDITCIWTSEGWLFLAIVLDLFSRRVVGFAMSGKAYGDLAHRALAMAIGRRLPAPGLVHHSDRGVQYASLDYQGLLRETKMICSMNRRANCWDNAVAESFFATLKTELVHGTRFRTRDEAQCEVGSYIESYYNHRRRHSTLGYVSPMEFEKKFEQRKVKKVA
jgi:putative transposase